MSYLSRMKVGNHVYIYEVSGYRDSNGNPRNKKHPVGKVDPETGQEIFKPDFIPKLTQYGKSPPAQNNGTFSVRDLKTSTIRDYGATCFLESIARQIGLKEVLSSSCGQLSGEILTLAEYLICSEDPFAYCAHWIEGAGRDRHPGKHAACEQGRGQPTDSVDKQGRAGQRCHCHCPCLFQRAESRRQER